MPGHFAQTGPVLGRLVRAGPVPVLFAPAGLFSGILHGPYLCPRTILYGPERCSAILLNPCRGILNRLYGPDLCARIVFGRPSLELPKQSFRRWLAISPHASVTESCCSRLIGGNCGANNRTMQSIRGRIQKQGKNTLTIQLANLPCLWAFHVAGQR